MPLTGDPRQFSHDAYLVRVFLQVFYESAAADDRVGPLPLNVLVLATDQMADYSVIVLRRSGNFPDYQEINLVIRRNAFEVAAIDAPLVVPLILAVIVFHLFIRQNPERRQWPQLYGVVATIVLTVLPLRAVLVPGQIPGLTKVDYVLGGEVLVILALGMVAYLLDIWAKPIEMPASAPAPMSLARGRASSRRRSRPAEGVAPR